MCCPASNSKQNLKAFQHFREVGSSETRDGIPAFLGNETGVSTASELVVSVDNVEERVAAILLSLIEPLVDESHDGTTLLEADVVQKRNNTGESGSGGLSSVNKGDSLVPATSYCSPMRETSGVARPLELKK